MSNIPAGWSTLELKQQIRAALAEATRQSYMRPNAVDAVTDKNSGNNLGGDDFPTSILKKCRAINCRSN